MTGAVAGFIVALPEECRSLTDRRVHRGDCFALDAASMVCVAGIGPENATRAAQTVLAEGADRLLSWGCAAALVPALKPGDLCLPEQIVDVHKTYRDVSRDWHRSAHAALTPSLQTCTARLLSTDRIAASVVEKQALNARFHAIAVDMESVAIAAVANERNVPFLVVRAIADPADMAVPGAVLRATDAHGDMHQSRLVRHLLRHPGELPALLRLALHFRTALRTLTAAACRMRDARVFGDDLCRSVPRR